MRKKTLIMADPMTTDEIVTRLILLIQSKLDDLSVTNHGDEIDRINTLTELVEIYKAITYARGAMIRELLRSGYTYEAIVAKTGLNKSVISFAANSGKGSYYLKRSQVAKAPIPNAPNLPFSEYDTDDEEDGSGETANEEK